MNDLFQLAATNCKHQLVIIPERASIYDSELAINHVLMIKSFVIAISPLYEALGSSRTELLLRIREVCKTEAIQPVCDLISNTINEDVSYVKAPIDLRHQRTYAVKVEYMVPQSFF
jgi:DNA mismatch repair protein MSH4